MKMTDSGHDDSYDVEYASTITVPVPKPPSSAKIVTKSSWSNQTPNQTPITSSSSDHNILANTDSLGDEGSLVSKG